MPLLEAAALEERSEQLLEVERVALGPRDDLVARRLVERPRAERREQLACRRGGKRVERDLGRAVRELGEDARAEPPSLRGRVAPQRRDEQERGAVGELEEVLGQLARRRVRPVQVLDREDDRRLPPASASIHAT